MTIIEQLARELNRPAEHIENVVRLLDEGNTIPFIARYRKELHGSMDDTALRTLEERLAYLRNLTERKESVKASIAEQEKLTDELAAAIDAAQTLAEVEDLYRPYKPKRRTRATVAKEKGLEPLAALLFAQERDCPRPEEAAADYLSAEKGVETVADALQGANDIVAEWISDDAAIRRSLRELLEKRGTLRSLAATEEDSVYHLYYDFEQPLSRIQGHQILAINRGEKEKMLSATVLLDRELALPLLRRAVVKPGSAAMEFVKAAAEDAYDRLIYPSLEREMRAALTDKASEGAIKTFALNLKPLLMQPPVKGHVTMGLDPGYAHGCKVAVIDATGKVLDTTVVYPTYGERQKNEAITKLAQLVKKHGVEHIAIGNGTASRETEEVVSAFIAESAPELRYTIVNEAGASVYSASKLASEEYPDLDVTTRGAMSLGRRLQDPLAELVKIPPQSIGVGQYQHDLDQAELGRALGNVVENVVNRVGVDVNSMKPLDNLCHPVSVIREAEELAADAFGAAHAFLMVGGTTSSVQSMVLSTCKRGDKIIMPRNVHRSVINALVLSGAEPVYVNPEMNHKLGIALGMSVAQVEKAILENPSAKAKGRLNARTEKNLRICAEICGDGDGVVAATRLHSYCFYSGKQAFFRWFWKFHFLS